MSDLLILLALAAPLPASAPPSPLSDPDAGWRLRITPYLWAPSVDGSLKVDGIGGDGEDEGGSALDLLTGAAMLSFEAHRGDWSLIGDLLWAEFGMEGTLDGPGATPFEAENDELLLGFAAARSIARSESTELEAVGGVRWFHVDLSIDPDAGTLEPSARADLVDPFFGLRGRIGEPTGPFAMGYADVGGFGLSSDLTWQVLAAGGWAYSWGDVRLGWRELAYDFDSGGILYDLTAGGPFLGVSFSF